MIDNSETMCRRCCRRSAVAKCVVDGTRPHSKAVNQAPVLLPDLDGVLNPFAAPVCPDGYLETSLRGSVEVGTARKYSNRADRCRSVQASDNVEEGRPPVDNRWGMFHVNPVRIPVHGLWTRGSVPRSVTQVRPIRRQDHVAQFRPSEAHNVEKPWQRTTASGPGQRVDAPESSCSRRPFCDFGVQSPWAAQIRSLTCGGTAARPSGTSWAQLRVCPAARPLPAAHHLRRHADAPGVARSARRSPT